MRHCEVWLRTLYFNSLCIRPYVLVHILKAPYCTQRSFTFNPGLWRLKVEALVTCDQSVMQLWWTFWTSYFLLPSAGGILDTRPCFFRQAQLPKFCACFPPRIEMRVPPVSGPMARVTSCTSCELPQGDVNMNSSRSSYKPLNLYCAAFFKNFSIHCRK